MKGVLYAKAVWDFKEHVWDFYRAQKRSFPWRTKPTPYTVFVSEMMLQQTQTERVIPKFQAFIKRFPTVTALAVSSQKEVLSLWQGLGYNRRALFLKRTADVVVEKRRCGKIQWTFSK